MSIDKILAALDILRTAIPYAATNTVIAFLYIGQHPGCHVMDVQRACGMQHNATARAIGILFKHTRGKPGKDLVEARVDWDDQRYKRLYLTPKGQKLFETIKEVIR